jgi:glutathione S-transferase
MYRDTLMRRLGMLRLYDGRFSGNCWKIRILLTQLRLEYQRETLDLAAGDAGKPEFLELSRYGRVPALTLEDGRTLVESSAILLYLAEGTRFLPDDRYVRSQIASWMFFEQGDLQRPLAMARVIHIRDLAHQLSQQLERLHADGYIALEKLERCLASLRWLVGGIYTVADLAVAGYVSLATEGGYDLQRFPNIRRWLADVHSQDGWIGIFDKSPYEIT